MSNEESVTETSRDVVECYYNARVAGKLRDFIHPNPRIEAAVQLIAEWAPAAPTRVLEIGCGVGHTSWRMARAWPKAEVIGSDISPASVEVAQTCFQRPNLTYRSGPLADSVTEEGFDLVVMTDVYEHIAPCDRPNLHSAIRRLMASEVRFILTIPTPALQDDGRRNHPDAMQPVDEDITVADVTALAQAVDARLVYYREVGIWRYGDYFHAVLARGETLAPVALRQPRPGGGRAAVKRLLGIADDPPGSRRDALGPDALRPAPSDAGRKFYVSPAKRRQLADAWKSKAG